MVEVECEICKKPIKGKFTWVHCTYFEYHPLDECGGCEYPVGDTCIKKVPKDFREMEMTVEEWGNRLKELSNRLKSEVTK